MLEPMLQDGLTVVFSYLDLVPLEGRALSHQALRHADATAPVVLRHLSDVGETPGDGAVASWCQLQLAMLSSAVLLAGAGRWAHAPLALSARELSAWLADLCALEPAARAPLREAHQRAGQMADTTARPAAEDLRAQLEAEVAAQLRRRGVQHLALTCRQAQASNVLDPLSVVVAEISGAHTAVLLAKVEQQVLDVLPARLATIPDHLAARIGLVEP